MPQRCLFGDVFLAASLCVFVQRAEAKQDPSSATIIEWNQIAQRKIGGPPFAQTRSFAMVHVAMADAVVAIEGQYEPFHVAIGARAALPKPSVMPYRRQPCVDNMKNGAQ